MALALEGIKVVEVATFAAVPMAGRLLGDWGADVIHIENPTTGDPWRGLPSKKPTTVIPSDIDYNWENFDRNKRGMTLDLAQEEGREVIYRLLKKADVFLNNLRPRELKKFNLEYATLSQQNPRLIFASLNSFGSKGPEKDMPGFDRTAFWPRSGMPHTISYPGTVPPPTPEAAGDSISGTTLACGVMIALYVRERTGVGQEVNISLFQTAVHALSFPVSGALVTGLDQQPVPIQDAVNPLTVPYQTADGKWLQLWMVQSDRYWPKFCQVIEREELEHDIRFSSLDLRAENHSELFRVLDEIFRKKTLAEWKARLNEAEIPWGPFQSLPEVISDPQARANNFFVPIDHPVYGRIEVVANPINLSQTPAAIRRPAPQFGQHTEEILLENGYTWEDIEKLKQKHVVA